MSQRAFETAMGMHGYAGSPAAAEDRATARDVASLVRGNGSDGMTTADATRLLGFRATAHLERAMAMGLIRFEPTNRRHLGRRWFPVSTTTN